MRTPSLSHNGVTGYRLSSEIPLSKIVVEAVMATLLYEEMKRRRLSHWVK